MAKKISQEEFVKQAIIKLRRHPYKGIHSVFSGFNEAFRRYFDGADPVEVTTKMSSEGKIVTIPRKGGVMLYLPEDAPQSHQAEEALRKMGLL